jgi:hypothetical protein
VTFLTDVPHGPVRPRTALEKSSQRGQAHRSWSTATNTERRDSRNRWRNPVKVTLVAIAVVLLLSAGAVIATASVL